MVTRTAFIAALGLSLIVTANPSPAAPLYEDTFAAGATYSASSPAGPYTAADETIGGTWTAGSGVLTYSRPNSGRDPQYRYSTSLLLTNGSTPATGSTAGLTDFTVRGVIRNVPADNTAQPGLVVSGSREQGGYVLTVDNGRGNEFALLAVNGEQILGDEGTPQEVVMSFGKPTRGDSYAIAVTVHRPPGGAAHPSFDVTITSVGPTNAGTLYDGSFTDTVRTASFGGSQIGYRVRNPLDGDAPAFGTLSLSVPEPQSLGLLGVLGLASRRRSFRPDRRTATD